MAAQPLNVSSPSNLFIPGSKPYPYPRQAHHGHLCAVCVSVFSLQVSYRLSRSLLACIYPT